MATLQQIKTAIENFRATYGPKIVARQEAYFAQHGHYWQGIVTPATPPDDGASVAPDYSVHPTDQTHTWLDVFKGLDALPTNLPCQIRVDTYGGPLGQGWSVTLSGTKDGMLYSKTWHVGPETWRAHDWTATPVQTQARSIQPLMAEAPVQPWYRRAWEWIKAQARKLAWWKA